MSEQNNGGHPVYYFNDKSYADQSSLLPDLKWHKFKVLSDGFVCLVDIMGTDSSIVQAARVSYGLDRDDRLDLALNKLYPDGGDSAYGKPDAASPSGWRSEWSITQIERATADVYRDERRLIRYLMRHRHSTPFEMVELKFLVRIPMDCWRQMIRHRTASVNEYSTRYSEAIDACDVTDPNAWRLQSSNNKQGSAGIITIWPPNCDDITDICGAYPSTKQHPGEFLSSEERELQALARSVYQTRLSMGIAREQARKDLPLSTYTEAYWKVDLHNLLHFLALRLHPHAQQEIREYATAIGKIVKATLPVAWEAFWDYRLNSMELTAFDIQLIQRLSSTPMSRDDFLANQPAEWAALKQCREREECFEKLTRLGLIRTDA